MRIYLKFFKQDTDDFGDFVTHRLDTKTTSKSEPLNKASAIDDLLNFDNLK